MSNLLLVCTRDRQPMRHAKEMIDIIGARIAPDNITPPPATLIEEDGIVVGIFNPIPSLPVCHTSVCIGHFLEHATDWHRPGTHAPDGTFALFRCDHDTVELVSDVVASRTIWYVCTDSIFVASTSQRAIVHILGDFQFQQAIIPWMLSSGTLGPSLSWDARIKCLPGNTHARLDRATWELSCATEEMGFEPCLSRRDYLTYLEHTLDEVFGHITSTARNYVVPLSGGYDSRLILLSLLKHGHRPPCVTWGTEKALDRKVADAHVASILAAGLGLHHEYLRTDVSSEPVKAVLDRYISLSEGRISNNIAGYMDGMAIWKSLYERGVHSIIRGDEQLGWRSVSSEREVRAVLGMVLLTDYSDCAYVRELCPSGQVVPARFKKAREESYQTYVDRLDTLFHYPVINAALNGIKSSYVEVVNPLLSRRLVRLTRLAPDALRISKSAYKEYVKSISPDVPFAGQPCIASIGSIMETEGMTAFLQNEHDSIVESGIFPCRPVDELWLHLSNRRKPFLGTARVVRNLMRSLSPERLRRTWRMMRPTRNEARLTLDDRMLAFRLYIISRMNWIMRNDAIALTRGGCLSPHRN